MSRGLESDDVAHLADRLAAHLQVSPTEAVKTALENELRRVEDKRPLRERLKPLLDRIDARGNGPDADKAFFDELSGDV